ncbi:SDR family oxidoreductase [Paraneptunicella aestuarii]|uniref:SDR family oxidoreductase n=1 Tax=Paraneptunicella aestuarii TaxID=2831148 RepID=UPI001E5EDA26|nr:SDR family oxidoreductase [Paraneptunicella aestuarii]UAA39064.1 SDR family oxidoreductase [Paraneptunicella aestuarii]
MTNKVALITGSSRGIGAKTALLFAQRGYAIVLNYRSSYVDAENLQREIISLGVECIAVQADVSKQEDVERLFKEADKLGQLAVLVNNAGILDKQSRLEQISPERFLRVLEVNVLSCFLCTKEAIKRMSTKYGGTGGAIVNVSSAASKTGSPNEYVDYAASKGAMDTLTRGAAIELADEGIRVNGVRPALIYTDMHSLGGQADRVDRLKGNLPLKRGGTPEEVAEAIIWLATEKSSFVTGSFIDTTGGL